MSGRIPGLALLAAALTAGCATFVADDDLRAADADAVSLECYWRHYLFYGEECHVSAVDGRRTGPGDFANLSARFKAGRRWVEFNIERSIAGTVGTEVCAFEHDFVAGHRYRLIAHEFQSDAGWWQRRTAPAYNGSIAMRRVEPSGDEVTQRVAVMCIFGGGSLCRTTADCEPHPDMVCRPLAGHAYGRCTLGP